MLKFLRIAAAFGLLALVAIGIPRLGDTVRDAKAQLTILYPNDYIVTVGTTGPSVAQGCPTGYPATCILPPNPSRRALMIANAGLTNIAWMAPCFTNGGNGTVVVPAANAAGSVGLPVATAAGVMAWWPPVNYPFLTAGVGQGWCAVSAASTTPLTILEW